MLVVAVLIAVGVVIMFRLSQRKALRELERLPVDDIPALWKKVGKIPMCDVPMLRMALLAEKLAVRGATGRALIIQEKDGPWEIDPITQPFEPRFLDEADQSFTALQSVNASQNSDTTQEPTVADSAGPVAAMKRNMKLRGGWPIVIILPLVSFFFLLMLLVMPLSPFLRYLFL